MDDGIAYIEETRFRKKELIFREGEIGNCMFEVERGLVGIFIDYGKPTEKKLTEIPVGSFFGEMGMVRGFPRSASAVALESDTIVSTITWETLGLYFKQSPSKIIGIMQQMGQRIQSLSHDYMGACSAVESLTDRCNSLSDENRMLHRELSRLLPHGPAAQEKPVWHSINGESEEAENARFQRYILEYQNYLFATKKQKQST
ncbi:MAG: cyclic nucleotide-binding domain-containing protein [Oscillospiraceae bacterium]|nr:cyclic nucleotide-binding domain-containing protein [Oscillospiraceae bacterium]